MKQSFSSAFLILTLLFLVEQAISSASTRNDFKYHQKLRSFRRALQEKSQPADSHQKKSMGRVIYPIGYGADPSGAEDSSEAIMTAVDDAVELVQNGLELLPGIKDLGGVVIDLEGGNYKISNPITLPPGIGNLLVQGGSLRASTTFPGNRHLIELSSPTSNPSQKDQIFYEDITFRDILFDSSFRGGGLLVVDSARIRVNNCFFLHFTLEGILVQRGHETFISNSFLGQHSTVGGDRGERDFSGVAIDISSNDNAVTDVAIFSAATGIILRGAANIITGVHCYNKATYFGGVGILVKAAHTRINNCYLDYNSVVVEDPHQVHVTNGFFLGDGNVVVRSVNGRISGLNIVNNMFSGEPARMVPIVKLEGGFGSINQVVIDKNNVNGMRLRSTVGRLTVPGNGTKWVVDFSSILVFPDRISHVHYSLYAPGGLGFPAHAVTNVTGNVVVVESDKAVNAVVSVVVDQYSMAGETNFLM